MSDIASYVNFVKNNSIFIRRAKIELLRSDETVFAEFSGDVIDGNVTIVRENGKRRDCNLTLTNVDGDYTPSAYSNIWINRKFKVWLGTSIDGVDNLFPYGVFYLTEPEQTSNITSNTITLSGVDKFGFLDGTVGGRLDGIYSIPLVDPITSNPTNINNALKYIVKSDDISDPAPVIFDSTSEVTPYTLYEEEGSSYGAMALQLRNILSRNLYYNANGNLRFEEDLDDNLKAVAFNFDDSMAHYLGGTARAKMADVYNVVVVIGDNVNGDIYSAVATNDDPGSNSRVSLIGKKVAPIVRDSVIYSDALASIRANYELKRYSALTTECTIECVPLFHLDVDNVITFTDRRFGFTNERFVITSISTPLKPGSPMTLTCVRTIDLITGIDTSDPEIYAVVPADNATNVSVSNALGIVFDQAVYGDSGYVKLYDSGDNLIQQWQGSSLANGTTKALTLSGDLNFVSDYYVLIDSDAFYNIKNEYFAGITDKTDWNFTTETEPLITTLDPPDDDTGVAISTDLVITFNQAMTGDVGYVKLYNSSDVLVEQWLASTLTPVGNVFTITLTSGDLDFNTGHYVQIDSNAFKNINSTYFAGISDKTTWNFTTELELLVSSFDPLDNATGVAVDKSPILTFNQNVSAGAGDIHIYDSGDVLFETIAASATSIVGSAVTINPTSDFSTATSYYILVDSDAFYNINNQYFAGISDKTTWNFTTTTAVYTGTMRTFFAVPGISTQDRLKIRPPSDATDVEIRRKTSAWAGGDDRTTGTQVGVINEYDSGTAYTVDDWVIYSGEAYICIQNGTGQQPDLSPTYWTDAGDLDNNIWYNATSLSDGTRYYFKAFPGKDGTYNETIGSDESSAKGGGLVHEYTMDDISGSSVNDTADSNNGTASNVTYGAGQIGNTGIFNGTTSYITLGTPSTFNRTIKSAGNGCAYECWMYLDTWGSAGTPKTAIFDENGWSLAIYSNGSGTISGLKYAGASYTCSATGLSLSTWYHVVYNVYSDYTTELFINGSSVDTDSNTTIPSNFTNGMFLGDNSASSQPFDGNIDQTRYYVRSLETYEITNLNNGGLGC